MKPRLKIKNLILGGLLIALLAGFSVFPSSAQEVTPIEETGEAVREKVRETIENSLNKPKAIVGELSAITDQSLQVETKAGEVLLASASADASYFRVSKSRRVEIGFSDLVLGEFMVAMGFEDDKNVLQAQRVITYETPPIAEKQSIMGVVSGTTNGTLFIEQLGTGATWEITVSRSADITATGEEKQLSLSVLEEGDRIVVVGIPNPGLESKLEATRVHKLASS